MHGDPMLDLVGYDLSGNPVYTLRSGAVSMGEYSGTKGGVTWNIMLPDGSPIGRKPYNLNKHGPSGQYPCGGERGGQCE